MRSLMTLLLIWMIVVPSASAAPTGPVFAGNPAAVAEMQAVFDNFSRVNSYRGRMSGPSAGIFEWVRPNRMRMIMTTGGQTIEMVVIEGKAWMKMKGQCRAMPGGQAMQLPTEVAWGTHVESVKVTKGGTQTINGTRIQVYNLETKKKDGGTGKSTTYVDLRTRLPRRFEATEESGGKMTIDYLEYNIPITITPPC